MLNRNRFKSFHIDLIVDQRILALDVSMSNIDFGMEVVIGDKVKRLAGTFLPANLCLVADHKWHSRVSCLPRDHWTRVACHTYIQTCHVVPEGCHPWSFTRHFALKHFHWLAVTDNNWTPIFGSTLAWWNKTCGKLGTTFKIKYHQNVF